MRALLTSLLIAATAVASAQTPRELLQLAQDAYRNPNGYEIHGRGSVLR